MYRERIALNRSRLGVRMIAISLVAVLMAAGAFLGIRALGNHVRNSAIIEQILRQDNYLEGMLRQFQDFVTMNGIQSTDYLEVKVWLSHNTGIGFLYDENAGEADKGAYPVEFEDGTRYVVPYVSTTRYASLIHMVAFAGAFCVFVLIMGLFVKGIISDIKYLSHDMIVLSGGDLDHEVRLKGNGELKDLADNMDKMRLSMIERIRGENEALSANHELITSLSHDLRTPLTKQLVYLEMALSGKYDEDREGMANCLNRTYKAACELRERSEELFSYFLVFNDQEVEDGAFERLDGQLLINQLLDEQGDYLTSREFTVECRPIEEPFTLLVSVPYLSRIVDNMISNIVKYADAAVPIRIECAVNERELSIAFINAVKRGEDRRNGTQIGLRSARKLAEIMSGRLAVSCDGEVYHTVLYLPIERD